MRWRTRAVVCAVAAVVVTGSPASAPAQPMAAPPAAPSVASPAAPEPAPAAAGQARTVTLVTGDPGTVSDVRADGQQLVTVAPGAGRERIGHARRSRSGRCTRRAGRRAAAARRRSARLPAVRRQRVDPRQARRRGRNRSPADGEQGASSGRAGRQRTLLGAGAGRRRPDTARRWYDEGRRRPARVLRRHDQPRGPGRQAGQRRPAPVRRHPPADLPSRLLAARGHPRERDRDRAARKGPVRVPRRHLHRPGRRLRQHHPGHGPARRRRPGPHADVRRPRRQAGERDRRTPATRVRAYAELDTQFHRQRADGSSTPIFNAIGAGPDNALYAVPLRLDPAEFTFGYTFDPDLAEGRRAAVPRTTWRSRCPARYRLTRRSGRATGTWAPPTSGPVRWASTRRSPVGPTLPSTCRTRPSSTGTCTRRAPRAAGGTARHRRTLEGSADLQRTIDQRDPTIPEGAVYDDEAAYTAGTVEFQEWNTAVPGPDLSTHQLRERRRAVRGQPPGRDPNVRTGRGRTHRRGGINDSWDVAAHAVLYKDGRLTSGTAISPARASRELVQGTAPSTPWWSEREAGRRPGRRWLPGCRPRGRSPPSTRTSSTSCRCRPSGSRRRRWTTTTGPRGLG